MATAVGPDIVEEGLVFGYDTNYSIADNVTGTRFYPGESTINLIPSSAATGTGNFSRSGYHNESFTYSNVTNYRGRANVHRLYINPSGNTAAPYADYGGQYYKSGGSVVGDVYAISFDFYVAKGNNSPSLSTTYANGYKSPTNAGAASITANSDVDLGNGWTRRTRIATITIAGNTHWRFGLNTGGNETEAYLDNVQIELKSRATPFIDGTRSSTASLIDLKETADIDVSNVSFDSTGQPEFDGTNDVITTSFPATTISNVTIEAVVYRNQATTRYEAIVQNNQASDDALYVNPSGFLMFWPCGASSLTVPTGQWSHVAVSYNGTTLTYIVNGNTQVLTATCSHITDWDFLRVGGHGTTDGERWIGKIAVAKVYEKSLSAAELIQNYNALKNRFDI
jgi:hypothetical protein